MRKTESIFSMASVFMVLVAYSIEASASSKLSEIFSVKKPIIGVINLPALPGQTGFVSMDRAVNDALKELSILEAEGVDGAILENNEGDFEATPEMLAAMTLITGEAVKKAKNVVVGVEVLWHDPKASLAIAKATGAKFIRTDFFTDKMQAGKRIIDENPKNILDYRDKIGAQDVAIFTDVQVKYAVMIDKKKTVVQSAKEAHEKGSDGVVVTGRMSGVPPDAARVRDAKKGAGTLEVILGSGTSKDNVGELLAIADGAIVGTSISTKTGGTLIAEKVREYMTAVKKLR